MTRKTDFFEGWSWIKLNNYGLTLDKDLKFYTSVTKGLKLKVRKFWGLIRKKWLAEVTEEKLVRRPFCPPSILRGERIGYTILYTLGKMSTHEKYDLQAAIFASFLTTSWAAAFTFSNITFRATGQYWAIFYIAIY